MCIWSTVKSLKAIWFIKMKKGDPICGAQEHRMWDSLMYHIVYETLNGQTSFKFILVILVDLPLKAFQ